MNSFSYIKPRTTNQIFYRKLGAVGVSNTIFSLYYSNVGGTIIPAEFAVYETNTSYPAPRTSIANTQSFEDRLQAPFVYFDGQTQSGPYTYPNPAIPLLFAPTTNSPQYVEPFIYTHNSTITRHYYFQMDYSGNGIGVTTGIIYFYLYVNGVEVNRLGHYSASAYGNRGSQFQAIITLAPNDVVELRYSQSNSTGSSERIRNLNVLMYELKN